MKREVRKLRCLRQPQGLLLPAFELLFAVTQIEHGQRPCRDLDVVAQRASVFVLNTENGKNVLPVWFASHAIAYLQVVPPNSAQNAPEECCVVL